MTRPKLVSGKRSLPSLATVLGRSGFETHALHSYYGWFYNRYDVMPLLGFDEFICQTSFVNPCSVYGTWVQDHVLYSETLDVMKNSDGRDFCYLATMETHGDYKYAMDDGGWFTNTLSEQSANNLNTYFSILNDADTALGNFLTELSTWDEPTVVLLFGDHIPSLGTETYAEIGFDTTSDESFQTPYFIWNNFGAEFETAEETVDMPINELGVYLLSLLGYHRDDPYFSLMTAENNGKEDSDLTKATALLTYDLLYGDQMYLSMSGTDLSNTDYKIGYEMDVENASWYADGNQIIIQGGGTHLNSRCQIHINGDNYPIFISGTKWSATIPCETMQANQVYDAEIFLQDNRGTVISRSNLFSIFAEDSALDSSKVKLAEDSLTIEGVYPGTEITQEMLKSNGSLDVGITSTQICENTVIYVNDMELSTFYGNKFISATIPAEIVELGVFELHLYNYWLDQESKPIVFTVAT